MIVPFLGSQKHNGYKRSYNFYLSQQRIRIEMAFGRLTTKWRICRRNLDFLAAYNSKIVEAACKLHNYVLNEDNVFFYFPLSLTSFIPFFLATMLNWIKDRKTTEDI